MTFSRKKKNMLTKGTVVMLTNHGNGFWWEWKRILEPSCYDTSKFCLHEQAMPTWVWKMQKCILLYTEVDALYCKLCLNLKIRKKIEMSWTGNNVSIYAGMKWKLDKRRKVQEKNKCIIEEFKTRLWETAI